MSLKLLLFVLSQTLATASDGNLESAEERAFKQAAALAGPSVVRIETVGGLDQLDEVLLANGPTSGVVVSEDGYIISSSFNFVAKPTSILVTLPDGRRLAAKQIANDRLRLLTLLKVDATGLLPAKPAPREEIKVGQWAISLGRTLDNSTPSVSIGIVSALNRVWGKAIQTDAKTSPINYGGALIDVEGRTLGVIAPLNPTGSGEMAGVEWYDGGIGFAIPLEDIYASLERLKLGTDLLPGLMGVTFVGGQALNVPAVIDRVRYNSPAQVSGVQSKDRIVEADGEKIVRVAQVRQILGRKYAGDTLKLVVQRGEESLPLEVGLVGQLIPYEFPFLGVLPERKPADNGVVLRYVFDNSPAQKAGLVRSDRVIKFNDVEVKDGRALSDLVSRARPGDKATMVYIHDGNKVTAEATLSSLPESVVAELPSESISPSAKPLEAPTANDAPPKVEGEKKSEDGPKTGRFTDTLAGHDHEYWAYVPESYSPLHSYGLMVWIHPPGDLMESEILKLWKTICSHRGLILIAPKAEKLPQWQPGEAEFIKGLIEHFREKYSIDASRIVLHSHGVSAGMAWLLAMKQRELVRGVVVSSAPYFGPPPENVPEYRQQFFFVCGAMNKVLSRVKDSVQALRKLKFPVTFNTVTGLGPKYPSESTIEEIGRWVDSLDRI